MWPVYTFSIPNKHLSIRKVQVDQVFHHVTIINMLLGAAIVTLLMLCFYPYLIEAPTEEVRGKVYLDLYVCLPVCLSFLPVFSVCLSFPSVYLSICLYVCMSVWNGSEM